MINKNDFLPDEVIEQPLKGVQNLEKMEAKIADVVAVSKKMKEALKNASSTVEIKDMVDALTKEHVELKKSNTELQVKIDKMKKAKEATEKSSKAMKEMSDNARELAPGLHNSATGFIAMTKAALAFIMTPIGLVIAAVGASLYALTAYFKGSEEGQNRLNKIVQIGKAIFEQFMNVVEDIGEAIFNAISNPQKAIKEFGKLILDNIITRFNGLVELIPALANALVLLFSGKFSAAGKVAADAIGKVVLGVENGTGKIAGLIKETEKLVKKGTEAGKEIARLEEAYDKSSRALIVRRAQTELQIQKIRIDAAAFEGEQRKIMLLQAIKLERDLGAEEVRHAQINLSLQKELLTANGDDIAAKMAVAEATANLFNVQAKTHKDNVRFAKEIGMIDRQLSDEELKKLERVNKFVEREAEASKKSIDIVKQEIEIKTRFEERFVAEQLARNESITQSEQEQQKERRRTRKQEIAELQEEILFALGKIGKLYDHFSGVIGSILNNITGNQLERINTEEAAYSKYYESQIEMAGENVERRTQLENEFAAKKNELDRKRAAATRKNAIFEKATNLAEAIMNTAKAIAEFGLITPYAIAAAIMGAVQISVIANTKIPSYAKGTKKHGGGLARVGEQGTEAIIFPDNRVQLSPNSSAIMDLPVGSAVLSHKDTLQFLALVKLNERQTRINTGSMQLGKYFQELNYTIKNKRETHYNWTKQGLERAFQNGESKRYFKNHFYK